MPHREKQVANGSLNRGGCYLAMQWGLACLCLGMMAPLAGMAQGQNPAGNAQHADLVTGSTSAVQAQNVTAPAGEHDMKAGQKNLSPAVATRQKQLADDSTKLLALAEALKTEVDKTNRNMLSVAVIRRAEEIEKLAHNVKDKLKQNAGGI